MSEYIADRFRELGATDRQVGLLLDGRECVRDTFLAIDERGEARKREIIRSVSWAESTVEEALRQLRRGFRVIKKRPDPIDRRQVIFYIDDTAAEETGGVDAAPPCRRCLQQSVRDGLCDDCFQEVKGVADD